MHIIKTKTKIMMNKGKLFAMILMITIILGLVGGPELMLIPFAPLIMLGLCVVFVLMPAITGDPREKGTQESKYFLRLVVGALVVLMLGVYLMTDGKKAIKYSAYGTGAIVVTSIVGALSTAAFIAVKI